MMTSARRVSRILALALGVTACDALFGEATQCSGDADCAPIGGVCADDGFCARSGVGVAAPNSTGMHPDGGARTNFAIDSDGTSETTESAGDSGAAPVKGESAPITIGEANILGIDDSGNAGRLLAQEATLTQAATLTSLAFYVGAAAGKLRLGVYDATGPGGGPGEKKAETAEFVATVGFGTVPVTAPVVLPAGSYWLAFTPESNDLHFRRAGDQTGKLVFFAQPYGPMPVTFSKTPATIMDHWSFTATLTPN